MSIDSTPTDKSTVAESTVAKSISAPANSTAVPATTTETANATKSPSTNVGENRLWHRRPGQKIDDLLLKRHLRYAPLTRLINQSDQRESLSDAVRALLPDSLADSVRVINYRPPALVLRVGNASLATRLRYLLPELTIKLRNLADFNGLTKINLRVVQSHTPKPPEPEPRYLPTAAVDSLTELAETLGERPDYRQLRDTILRLSEHTASAADTD